MNGLMATTHYSWLISVPIGDAPERPLSLHVPEFGDLLERYEGLYLWNKSPRHTYPEAFVADVADTLSISGLSYLLQPFRLLRGEDVKAAVDAYEALLQVCGTAPERITCRGWILNFDHHEMRAALRMPEEELRARVRDDDIDGPTFWKFLGYLRANLDWLRAVDTSRECVVYVFD